MTTCNGILRSEENVRIDLMTFIVIGTSHNIIHVNVIYTSLVEPIFSKHNTDIVINVSKVKTCREINTYPKIFSVDNMVDQSTESSVRKL